MLEMASMTHRNQDGAGFHHMDDAEARRRTHAFYTWELLRPNEAQSASSTLTLVRKGD